MRPEDEIRTRRALVIVNRTSLRGDTDLAAGLDQLRADGFDLKPFPTDTPDEIPGLLRAHSSECDLAIVGGGDGTMNAAAEALVDCGLPLGILPLGTANDLARTLGIAASPQEACSIIANGRLHAIDLGLVNGKYFFNVASIGLAADVPRFHKGERKKRWGLLSYIPSMLDAYRRMETFRAEIVQDGKAHKFRCIQIAVGNGRHYGGGLTVDETAHIDDEKLDLYILKPQSFSQLLALAPALRFGKHGTSDRVETFRGKEFTIRTKRRKPINADGELVGQTPARFSVKPKALNIIVPQDYVGSG